MPIGWVEVRLRIQIVSVGLLALTGVAICQRVAWQTPAQENLATLDRKIELVIRSQYSLPGNCDVRIGQRTPTLIPGYDNLHVTVTLGAKSSDIDFLISTDSKTLGHLDKFEIDDNPALSIDVNARPIRGNPNAPVTVINFDDLECPVCSYMNQQLFPAALNRYGDEVRFIYKDNPLVEMHPWALRAAVDATCLASQSQTAYWNYVDNVHSQGQQVSGGGRDLQKNFAVLDRMAGDAARKTNLDSNTLQACLEKQDEAPVRQSMREAKQLGLDSTPALFVNGEEVRGFSTLDGLWPVIDRALRESGLDPPKTVAPESVK
jgi:protein-disulfide isomerase